MTIIRKPVKDRFTIVDNSAITDERLSLKTLGLYLKMMSLPDDWNFSEKGLMKAFKCGHAELRTGLKQLEECGYVQMKRTRDKATGRFVNQDWIINEISTNLTTCDFPSVDNPSVGNHIEYNTNQSITKEYNILLHLNDKHIQAFTKAYKDTFDADHRSITKEYNNIYKYDPADIYLMACEFMKDYPLERCSIDYFEKVIDRYKGIEEGL